MINLHDSDSLDSAESTEDIIVEDFGKERRQYIDSFTIDVVESDEKDNDFVNNSKLVRNTFLYIGLCFFILFSGFAPFRSLVPAIRPASGPWYVAVNFLSYAFGSLVNPNLLKNQRRLCLAFSALCHAQWIAVLQISVVDGNAGYIALHAMSSALNGLGAGILWSTQGGIMTSFCAMDATKHASHYTGIFLSFYGASGFIGNVVAAITLYFASSLAITNVIWALFSLALCGGLMMLFTPSKFLYEKEQKQTVVDLPRKNEPLFMLSSGISKRFHAPASTQVEEKKTAKRWKTIKALFTETVFTRSIPGICALSSVSVFSWVLIPTLCSSAYAGAAGSSEMSVNSTVQSGAFIVPTLFAIYALANAIGAPTSSLLHKKFTIPTVFWATSLFLVVPLMVYFMVGHPRVPPQYQLYGLAVSSFIFGIVVGTYNNSLYALYASSITLKSAAETSLPQENQPHLPLEAYCIHGFLYCVFYTFFSILVSFTPLIWMAAVVTIIAIASALSFMIKFN